MRDALNLFIASDVRSGSTYAAESIAYTLNQEAGAQFWDLAQEKFSSLSSRSEAPDILDVYDELWVNEYGFKSAKIMCASLSIILNRSKQSAKLRRIFFGSRTYWIVVRRRNKIRQAVSLAFAKKSGLFHFYGQGEAQDAGIQVSDEEVMECFKAILLSDEFLGSFAKKVSNVAEFHYEDFVGAEAQHMNNIFSSFGLHQFRASIVPASPKIRPTAPDQKIATEMRFREHFLNTYFIDDEAQEAG